MDNVFASNNCWNRIYCGDNLKLMGEMVDAKLKFNLILADGPYNIGKKFGNDSDCLSLEDFLQRLDERLKLMKEILSPNGSIILFCTHLYIGDIQMLLRKYFFQRRMQIWYYENGISRQTHEPVTEYEPFWWFSNSEEDFIYNMDDVRVPYKTDRVRNPVYKLDSQGNKKAWNPDPRGRKRGDVWTYPTLAGKHFEEEKVDHPTQKPLSLFIDLIKAHSSKDSNGFYDARVLDPYCGSGTTAVACKMLNAEIDCAVLDNNPKNHIQYIGLELEQKYVGIANERLARIK